MRRALEAHIGGTHAGLILDRFGPSPPTAEKNSPEMKERHLEAVRAAAGTASTRALYAQAFERRRQEADPNLIRTFERTVDGAMVIGIGIATTLEVGLRLHHTYGVPFVPGSAIKGLAAHWCARVLGDDRNGEHPAAADWRAGGLYHRFLFGTQEEAGAVVFEDAWPLPGSLDREAGGLRREVMTPHHPDWQGGKGPPTDFDSPNPVGFLSMVGRYAFRLAWNGPTTDTATIAGWLDRAAELVSCALAEWGIGAKTSSGFGRLVEADTVAPRGAASEVAAAPIGLRAEKRGSGTPTRVTIVAARPKGGFDVQEEGYAAGTLTLGAPPDGVATDIGAVVAVQVHNDDPSKPQYKWPVPPKPSKPAPPKRR